MKRMFFRRVSSLLSLTAFSVALGCLSAQAETEGVLGAASTISATNETQLESAKSWWNPAIEQTEAAAIEGNAAPAIEPAEQKAIAPNVEASDTLPKWQANSSLPSAEYRAQPATTEVAPVELSDRPVFSTNATDLNGGSATAQKQVDVDKTTSPDIAQVTRPIRRNPPGANFIGIGANIGDNEDVLDLAFLSKFRLTELPFGDGDWTLSARPTLAFSNGILDLRLPATIEFKQPTLTDELSIERLTPYAGGGVAISLDKDSESEFDLMLTAGADYLLTPDVSLTGMLNFLFLDDIDLEVQFGLGYNF